MYAPYRKKTARALFFLIRQIQVSKGITLNFLIRNHFFLHTLKVSIMFLEIVINHFLANKMVME